MDNYSVRDVERLLRLSRGALRGLIKDGFVSPSRGPRSRLQFSFQDLIVLRAARSLIEAKVPRRRVSRSLDDLRRHLPKTMPLSGLSISAVGERVVVREGGAHWQVEDGQFLLGFEVEPEQRSVRVIEHPTGRGPGLDDTTAPFLNGLDLEATDAAGAIEAYRTAVYLDPTLAAAWINWGRLLHAQGELRDAESVYRRALLACEPDAILFFNLGVVLEDVGHINPAVEAYQSAVEHNPDLADAHYNLARLYESLGKPQHAIRHLGQYRRLINRSEH
jgi:tetratricopeptide (TPR) repeat protein